MIIARVARGVSAHFIMRLQEWIFAGMLLGLARQLLRHEVNFEFPIYRVLAQLASEETWGSAMLLVGLGRVLALVFNGTFQPINRISPVVRSGLAGLSAFVWFALALGFYMANPNGVSVITYTGLMVSDIGLCIIIARESGAAYERARSGRCT
jgi:hypothetical protein